MTKPLKGKNMIHKSNRKPSLVNLLVGIAERFSERLWVRIPIVLWRAVFVDLAPNLPRTKLFVLTSKGRFYIAVYAVLISWILCLVIPGIWSYLLGTHLGDDPSRVYFFTDVHNLWIYIVFVPAYVAGGTMVISSVIGGFYHIRELEEILGCKPIEISSIHWKVPLLVLFLLAVAFILTSTYISDVSNIERVGFTYWFLEKLPSGDVKLSSLGVYYFLLNFLLLLFTLISLTFFMSVFSGTIRIAKALKSVAPNALSELKFDVFAVKLQVYVSAYLAAKFQVAAYICNFWLWEKSPLGNTGNVMVAHIFLFVVCAIFLAIPRSFFELQWSNLQRKSGFKDVEDFELDSLMAEWQSWASWGVDVLFISTILVIPYLSQYMSYSK
ncbi:hypothetical protein [Cellvibrio japonicus]|nr:hypothetical protein [Cellvibrio japonicus]QEI13620.1 hypothetical protein FY117_16310 [Cellvibrio japonicus]QEI17194.1 hypothetical protein FY116_16315 [Cellvibrio japonicus]QEI20771.1 hypothetical protein FY115_16310 [Cellvibrio japonicus]